MVGQPVVQLIHDAFGTVGKVGSIMASKYKKGTLFGKPKGEVVKHPGALKAAEKRHGVSTKQEAQKESHSSNPKIRSRGNLAKRFLGTAKRGNMKKRGKRPSRKSSVKKVV